MKALSRRHWTYVLEADKTVSEEEQTIFHLKNVSRALYTSIMDGADAAGRLNFSGSVSNRILKETLIGWENLTDPDTDQPIPFPEKADAALEMLPGVVRAELAAQVFARQTLTEEQRKNL